MPKANGFWSNFFRTTRSTYQVQHAARTLRAIASGNTSRVAKLSVRRVMYRGFNRFVNRLLR